MNKVFLIGNLTREPELRFVAGSGKAVANINIAVSRPFKKDETDFFQVVIWGKQAEAVANHLDKGSKVAVSGYVYNEHWEDKQGNKRTTTKINAEQIEFLSWKAKEQSSNDGFEPIEDLDSDLPF